MGGCPITWDGITVVKCLSQFGDESLRLFSNFWGEDFGATERWIWRSELLPDITSRGKMSTDGDVIYREGFRVGFGNNENVVEFWCGGRFCQIGLQRLGYTYWRFCSVAMDYDRRTCVPQVDRWLGLSANMIQLVRLIFQNSTFGVPLCALLIM